MIAELLGDDVREPGRYIAEVIYGANDGIVTTFAVVSGVAGAALDPAIVLVLGAANLLADGFSMGMSNYLSRRSEIDYRAAARGGRVPTDSDAGPAGPDAAAADADVAVVGREAAEADSDVKSPTRTALATFLAFVVAGWTPLVPYVFALRPLFELSVVFTGLAFFAVGASRSLVTRRRWYVNGAEMLAVGMVAAAVAFAVGTLLKGVAA